MADYWKSQPRHFCEFCKCWTADNKPSREFHEKGKRHQENVKQKLDTLRKKGIEDARKEKETESYLVRMEKAALKKCKEDLAADPSLASQYGVTVKSKAADTTALSTGNSKKETLPAPATSTASSAPSASQWNEALSPEGYVYYWNSATQESRWELPEELLTNAPPVKQEPAQIPQQIPPADNTPTDQSAAAGKKTAFKVLTKTGPTEDASSDVKEKSVDGKDPQKKKAKKAKQDQGPAMTKSEPVAVKREAGGSEGGEKRLGGAMAPTFRPAYGAWEEVKQVEAPVIDYQLPTNRHAATQPEVRPPAFTPAVVQERKHQFGERTVASLTAEGGEAGGAGGATEGFKKRKLNSGQQRGRNGRLGGEDKDGGGEEL